MRTKTQHLVHLAGLALLLYFFAITAKILGIMVAVAIFLPLGAIVELRFWWKLFTPDRSQGESRD